MSAKENDMAGDTSRKSISVVIPAWNESEVIAELTTRLINLMERQTAYDFEIIIVDNGSWDETWEMLVEVRRKDARFKLIQLSRNFMADGGVMAGLNMASGDAAVIMNADLQDPPELVDEFIEKWREGYEIIYGVIERRRGESWFKVTATDAYYGLVNRITGGAIPKDVSDFRLVDRMVYLAMNQMRERNRFTRGLSIWAGFKQTGISFVRPPRFAGESKAPFLDLVEEAWNGIYAYSYLPLKAPFHLGWIMLVAALVVFGFNVHSDGMESLSSESMDKPLLLLLAGLLFLVLGSMGGYIARILDEVRNRPGYIIRKCEGFEPGLGEIEHFGTVTHRNSSFRE
jgi:dolichol-phosphate mannosyltransferase